MNRVLCSAASIGPFASQLRRPEALLNIARMFRFVESLARPGSSPMTIPACAQQSQASRLRAPGWTHAKNGLSAHSPAPEKVRELPLKRFVMREAGLTLDALVAHPEYGSISDPADGSGRIFPLARHPVMAGREFNRGMLRMVDGSACWY